MNLRMDGQMARNHPPNTWESQEEIQLQNWHFFKIPNFPKKWSCKKKRWRESHEKKENRWNFVDFGASNSFSLQVLVATPSFFISIAWIKSRNIMDGCYREPWITPQGILQGDKFMENDQDSRSRKSPAAGCHAESTKSCCRPSFLGHEMTLNINMLANLCHSHSHTALRPIQQQSHRAIDRSGRL